MRQVKYPFKSDSIKSAKVLAECTAELLFDQCKKYRVLMEGFGNPQSKHELRYTIFSPSLDRVISYMQERANDFAKRRKPERIGVYIFEDKIDFNHVNNYRYHWSYAPTYR